MDKIITSKCKYCSKEYKTKSRKIEKGLLKGHALVDNAFCSSMCEGLFAYVGRRIHW